MQTKFIFTAIVSLITITNATAQNNGKLRPKRPSNFSWGATNAQSQGNGIKIDSLKEVRTVNTPSAQRKRKDKPDVKLDDLKDPFDSTKVKMEPRKPLQNNSGQGERRKRNNNQQVNTSLPNQPVTADTTRIPGSIKRKPITGAKPVQKHASQYKPGNTYTVPPKPSK